MIKKMGLLFLGVFGLFSTAPGFAAEMTSAEINQTLTRVYHQYLHSQGGKNADYIPELGQVNPHLFAIVIVTVKGEIYTIGDAKTPFAIESIVKPFTYALALQENGESLLNNTVGLNQTNHSFNSVAAIESSSNHLENPLVNAGAIQVTSMIQGNNSADKWQRLFKLVLDLSKGEGQPYLGAAVYRSEMATNQHNRAIAELLNSYGMIIGDPLDALDRYTKSCSIMVTARQLGLIGATLANKGRQPLTHQQLLSPKITQDVLSEMVVTGLYEISGEWFWNVGLPAKSGVGGGILAIVPNRMAIVVFSPPVDKAGNSVRGQKVMTELSHRWHLHILS